MRKLFRRQNRQSGDFAKSAHYSGQSSSERPLSGQFRTIFTRFLEQRRIERIEDKVTTDRQLNTSSWNMRATVSYTLFTFVIMIFSIYQTILIRQSLVAVQRAFVVADMPTLETTGGPDLESVKWEIRPSWHNVGNTLAENLILAFNCKVTVPVAPMNWDYKGGTIIEFAALSPQTVDHTGAETFSQQAITAAATHQIRLYCFGAVSYKDIFTHKHMTRFCREFLGFQTDGSGRANQALWGLCSGNFECVEQRCRKQA